MNKKLVGIFVFMLLIGTVFPATGIVNNYRNIKDESIISNTSDGEWCKQWVKRYDENLRSGGTNPIGDIDEDGINEVIVCGFNTSAPGVCNILSYDEDQGTYIEEYSWSGPDPDGRECVRPNGVSVIDLDDDGDLEFCVAWYDYYTDADGVFAYDWDGTTLTLLDIYNGSGFNWVYITLPCDYDDDGDIELVIGNFLRAPGPGNKHITALGWDNDKDEFVEEAFWYLEGYENKSCIIQSDDTDNDGKTEIIAVVTEIKISNNELWVLNWNDDIGEWEGEAICTDYPGNSPRGVDIGDLNGNGIPEIIVGSWVGLYPEAWLYEWNGTGYEEVWKQKYYLDEIGDIDFAVAIGDADNDGINELCIATYKIYIYQWDGTRYKKEAKLTKDSIGTCYWLNIGDCDSDGLNELKMCDWQLDGKEYIYKYQKPPNRPEIDGPMIVKTGVEIDFHFITTDPEGKVVKYYVDWGDGNDSGWTEFHNSGEEVTLSHIWDEKNLFNVIRCKTKDIDGGESDWRRTVVSIINTTNRFPYYWFLELFPLLEKLLYLLF
jgi:hypothetical protein